MTELKESFSLFLLLSKNLGVVDQVKFVHRS